MPYAWESSVRSAMRRKAVCTIPFEGKKKLQILRSADNIQSHRRIPPASTRVHIDPIKIYIHSREKKSTDSNIALQLYKFFLGCWTLRLLELPRRILLSFVVHSGCFITCHFVRVASCDRLWRKTMATQENQIKHTSRGVSLIVWRRSKLLVIL